MHEETVLEEPPNSVTVHELSGKSRLPVLAVALLVAALYADVVYSWMVAWWSNETYSHGFLVGAIALYMAWQQRRKTLATSAAPTSKGLYLTVLALVMYVAGRAGAEFFTMRLSLLVLICGLTLTFWGYPRLKRLAFPLLLLASVIPLPVIVFNQLAVPLQLAASRLSTQIVQSLGISIYRDGNIIQLSTITLGVVEACSGLRSLASLTVGALLLGYLEDLPPAPRVLVFFLAIPIAVLFNVLRIAGTAVLAERRPDWAMGFYHSLSGWLVFVAGFGVLFLMTKVVAEFADRKRAH